MTIKQEILTYSRQANISPLSPWFESALDELIGQGFYSDDLALQKTGYSLVQGLKDYAIRHDISTVVLGMSGGVDSALTAAMFKAAGWRVIGVTMPIHQKPEETARGIDTCNVLGIEHQHVDLTKTYDDLLAATREYDRYIDDVDHALRRGNLRVRLRMLTVYNIASGVRGLVGSTDNFSELAAGFWTLHGDVGDLAPIQSLSKSWEVPKLAEHYGVPASTVFAIPTDGLGISESDEAQFGFSYLEFDIVLLKATDYAAWHPEASGDDLMSALISDTDSEIDRVKLAKIFTRIKNSAFKRQNPYNLPHPSQNTRYSGLARLDKILVG